MQRILGVLLLLCAVGSVQAQNISNRGKEFWVGYGHHQFMEPGQNNSQEMVIYLSAEQAATVVVSINGTPWTRTYNVPANTVVATEFMPKNGTDDCRLYSVPPSFGGTGGEGIFNRGINIKSDVPIVAYAHIFGSVSSGATMLLPIDSWGYNHYTINSEQIDAGGPGYSWVFVVAQENNTEIRITPGALTRTGRPAGVPFNATLNKGQIFQIVGDGDAGGNGVQFTGTRVESIANASGQCFPIAVFAGSSRTRGESVPCGSGSGRDNDIQQCFPTSTWGKRYLTAPFSTSNGSTLNPNLNANVFMTSVYKVAVKDPTTVVKRNGVPLTGLINGRYYKYSSNTADYLESDKPIMVAQFMSGSSTCNPGSHGDPEMVYLSPIEQAIKRVGFYRNTREAIYSNYVTLIVPTAGVASLLIDGSNVFNHTYTHPNLAGYTVVVKGWKSAQAQASISCDSSFTAITYGLGGAESYGYNAGTYLNNLNLVGSIRNNSDTSALVKQHDFTCKNSPLTLSAFYLYKPTSLVWQLSALATVLTPSADVTDNSPVPVDSTFINGIKYYKYTLPGTYQFTDTGTFAVPILSSHPTIENCTFTEKLTYNITVKGTPRPIFTVSHTGCTLDTAYLTAQATTLNNYNIQQYTWTLPGPTTANTQQVKPVLPPGNHLITLAVVTQQGCVGDTTQPVNVFNKPVANFSYLPATICENATVTFTDNSGIPGTGAGSNWYWDFGNSTIVNATSGANQTTIYPYGTYTVKHVVRTSPTCFSDTVTQVITVYAKPRTTFTFPTNCLATNGQVQFTNGTTIPDGQTIPTWAWTFNDPNATAGNPNTSGAQNPTHNFAEGTYPVNLSATSQQGCVKDTTINVSVKITPALNYPALTSVCQNELVFSIANATVTNGVAGTGIYKGPGTTTAGQFNPSIAGPGTHTIWYIFTTNTGCIDSVSQTILVKAKPVVSYTYPTGGCLPTTGLAQFNGSAILSDGQTVSNWAWNFNDPNANAGNPNTSNAQNPTHNFTANGIYNVNLTVTSSGNCTGDTTIALNFNIKPALNYPALNNVCINAGGTVNVATATVTNGVSGTGVYIGPGTTAAGIFTPTVAGVGNHTIWYRFTTPNGCADSISQTILVKAKPVVSYTYPTGGCLPTNGLAQFNGTAVLSDGQTVSNWAWNFNDPNANAGNPNTSNAQNPTHNFTTNGIYNVNLTVTSSGNCTGDTTIALNFNIKPALNYPALNNVCINAGGTVNVATAIVTNGVSGSGVYIGPGTTAAGIFTPTVAGVGNHTIWYKFTTPNGCADSISQTILVKAKPVVSYTYPTGGCLPTNGLAQFNGTAVLSDGQIVSNWAWNFNDPNANAGNPNTSNAQNPTHNFTANGIYNVNLTVTSSGNCTGDTTIALNFNIKPALNYPALAPVCQNVPGTISVATATVTNGASGTGVYIGAGTTAAGQFSPSAAGAGTHTIWYKFTTPNGCADSVSQTITVNPKPTAQFTATPSVCLGSAVTFTDGSSISSGNISQWQWNFGNSTTANYANGNPFSVNYATADTFIAKLVTMSALGCTSDTASRTIIVHPIPVANFSTSNSVCMPGGAVVFTNQSTLTGNNNSMTYVWNFGDASAPNTNTSPSHIYAASNNYTITLTATSVAGGCSHQVSKPFNAFFEKPVAAFAADPDTLCQGKPTVFDDLSTDPAGSAITGWSWNFADGSAPATVQSPVKTYTQPGNYVVTLRVTNAAGCISDIANGRVVVYLQPVVDAGPSFTVPQGTLVTFNPVVNDPSLNFVWSPATGLSSATVLKPSLTAIFDQTYTLRATGQGGCTASDFLIVKVLKGLDIPNAFSPNGDGTNDRWEIGNLADYTDCEVQVFNRYGQRIYQSRGYTKPWDGTVNGTPMPVGVYYYVIDLKNGLQKLNGSVTIVR